MVFSTAQDNQPIVDVHVLQGERPMAEDNKTLGRFQLVGIPPAPRGVPQIEVSYDIDANGIVNVSARDLGTGRQQKIRIIASSGLTEEEIDRMVKEAEASRDQDRQRKEMANLTVAAEGLIWQTENTMSEYGSMVKEEDREDIQEDLEQLKSLLNTPGDTDYDTLKAAMDRLTGSAQRLAEAMYEDFDADAPDDDPEQPNT
jgi:molecular chaperone DnaK